MMNPMGVSYFKTIIATAAALLILQGCEKKKEDETEDPSTSVTIATGSYYTSCVAVPGAAIAGAGYTKTLYQMNAGGVDNAYSITKFFTSDSGCNTNVYAINQSGAYAVGSAIPTLTNGYLIGFTPGALNLLLYSNAASTTIHGGCGSAYPVDQGAGVYPVSADIACAYMDMAVSGSLANSIVIDGSDTLTLGTPDGDNPGVVNSSNLSLTQTLSITK